MRLWKSLTNDDSELVQLSMRYRSASQIRCDGILLNRTMEERQRIIEELDIAEGEDILIVEVPKEKDRWVLIPSGSS